MYLLTLTRERAQKAITYFNADTGEYSFLCFRSGCKFHSAAARDVYIHLLATPCGQGLQNGFKIFMLQLAETEIVVCTNHFGLDIKRIETREISKLRLTGGYASTVNVNTVAKELTRAYNLPIRYVPGPTKNAKGYWKINLEEIRAMPDGIAIMSRLTQQEKDSRVLGEMCLDPAAEQVELGIFQTSTKMHVAFKHLSLA